MDHGLLIHEVSRSHTTTRHSRYDFSGRVISPSQRLVPDHTQHSQQTSTPPVGFDPTISAGERPQTYALDRAATGTYRQYFIRQTKLLRDLRFSQWHCWRLKSSGTWRRVVCWAVHGDAKHRIAFYLWVVSDSGPDLFILQFKAVRYSGKFGPATQKYSFSSRKKCILQPTPVLISFNVMTEVYLLMQSYKNKIANLKER